LVAVAFFNCSIARTTARGPFVPVARASSLPFDNDPGRCAVRPDFAELLRQAQVSQLVLLHNLQVPLENLLLRLHNLLLHRLLIPAHRLLKRNWIQGHREFLRDRLCGNRNLLGHDR
jgi:hypothetical protein